MHMNYGHLELRIEELLKERDISKNTICKELDIPRSNFNRYCRNEFQRLDANLICKLCDYFDWLCKRITSCCCYWHGMDKRVCGGVKVSHTFLLVYFIKSNYTVSSES